MYSVLCQLQSCGLINRLADQSHFSLASRVFTHTSSFLPRDTMLVMRETLDGFQGGLQIGGQMITNLRYADDIILLATSEAELQELVDRLDHVSRKYSLLNNVDKTKVMASDGIRAAYSFRINCWSRWIRSRNLGP